MSGRSLTMDSFNSDFVKIAVLGKASQNLELLQYLPPGMGKQVPFLILRILCIFILPVKYSPDV